MDLEQSYWVYLKIIFLNFNNNEEYVILVDDDHIYKDFFIKFY